MQVICLIVITLSTFLLLGNSLAFASESHGRNYYIGAIFEHGRRGNKGSDTPDQIKQINLAYYKKATEAAKSKGADIIVFPEYGIIPPGHTRKELDSFLESIPDPRTGLWNPCEMKSMFSDRPVLRTLSCMAKENNINILANMGDAESCTKPSNKKCPDNGVFHYNANVVFNRQGTIISRYRKEHPFFELGMDQPTEPQNPFFTTDIGTFASFISFDAIYKPVSDALLNTSVDAVILSTMWVELMPHSMSVERFQSLTSGTKGTLLAANAQISGFAAVGSGFFTGEMGALKYTFNPDGESKLVISRVPLSRKQAYPFPNPEASIMIVKPDAVITYNETEAQEAQNVPEVCSLSILGDAEDSHKDFRCVSEDIRNYTLIRLTKSSGHVKGCNNRMCCSLNYSAKSMDGTFFLAIFNGTHNSFNRYFWCQELCFVARCLPFNGSDCGHFPTQSNTVFRKFDISANFSTGFVYPLMLESGVRVVPVNKWNFDTSSVRGKGRIGEVRYKNYDNKALLAGGLLGRCFDRDPPYIR